MTQAIDIHVHPATTEWLERTIKPFTKQTEQYFRTKIPVVTIDEMAVEFEAIDTVGVLFAWDAETTTGLPRLTNDWVAEAVAAHPGRFYGFASVDPHKGRAAVEELERAVTELGLIGVKMHPVAQAFHPNDEAFYPIWQKAAELGVPVLFHTGNTGLGAGTRGGMGMKLEYARPIYLDSLAADMPELEIIGAHPSWPWQDEMLMVALHKTNVWIDLSGWSPKYFSPELVREIKTRLSDRVLFGTDYPFITHEKWFAAFDALDPTPEVRRKVLLTNAARLLKIEVDT